MATNKKLDDLREIMLETARIQFAALNAGVVFWSGWVDNASKTAEAIGTQLASVGKQESDTDKILGSITDLSREFLRKTTELPSAAVARFNAHIKPPTKNADSRRRLVRAKP